MAAPILWVPGKMRSFCRKKPTSIKFLLLGGGRYFGFLGACAMTTKFLDNIIFTFKFLLSWRFLWKIAFLDNFPLCPPAPPPLKNANFIFIVVSLSLSLGGGGVPILFLWARGFFWDNSLHWKISLVTKSAWSPLDGPPFSTKGSFAEGLELAD